MHEIRKYGGSSLNHLESYVLFELDSFGAIYKIIYRARNTLRSFLQMTV